MRVREKAGETEAETIHSEADPRAGAVGKRMIRHRRGGWGSTSTRIAASAASRERFFLHVDRGPASGPKPTCI